MKDEQIIDDWSLMSQAAHDMTAIRQLFIRHKDYVYRLALGFLGQTSSADDVVQEVFMRLTNIKTPVFFKAKFTTWLYQVVLNVSREYRRKHNKEFALAVNEENNSHDDSYYPDESEYGLNVENCLLNKSLARALQQLPERQREAVVLRYMEELSTKETAKIMGCREGSVKSHLQRALSGLREYYR